jgi:hypothetical protein
MKTSESPSWDLFEFDRSLGDSNKDLTVGIIFTILNLSGHPRIQLDALFQRVLSELRTIDICSFVFMNAENDRES